MKLTKKTSAFPKPDTASGGMTVRQYFALEILKGFLSNENTNKARIADPTLIEASVNCADALIEHLNETENA